MRTFWFKKWIFIIPILFYFQPSFGSDSLRLKKLELVSKVWGITILKTEKKIKKPELELLKLIKICDNQESYALFTDKVLRWCKKNLQVTDKENSQYFQSTIYNSFLWTSDTTLLGRELSEFIIQKIKSCNTKESPQYKIEGAVTIFYEDKSISSDTILKNQEYLLAGIKYWNMVNYFYPYIDKPEIQWNLQLKNILTSFDTITQYKSYYLCLLQTSKKLNDGHARIYSSWAANHLFQFEVPFETEIYEHHAIITKVDTMYSDFKLGDWIVAINNQPINNHLQHWDSLLSSSTRGWFLHTVRNYLFASSDSTLNITIVREGVEISKNFALVKAEKKPIFSNEIVYNMSKDSIGYIHLGNLQLGHMSSLKRDLQKAKVIIVDARFYPNSTLVALSSWLVDEQKPFATFEIPVSQCLGSVKKETTTTVANEPLKFQGLVLFLTDRSTISQGEYMAMAFMQSSNVITIGRATAGSVGTTSQFSLPGKIECRITTSKCMFPNSMEIQQKGIRPSVDLSESDEINCSDDLLKFSFEYAKRIIQN